MLNQHINPQQMTRNDFEKHVDALQQAIAKHLDINTQKKGKLRDIAAKTLFGFDNGYQQALAHFYQPAPPMPLPDTRMSLPNEVTLIANSELTYVVFGPSETRYRMRQEGDFLHAVLDEYSDWTEDDEVDTVSDDGTYSGRIDVSRSQVVRQLHHDYILHEMEVRMPRIDKYGISPEAYPDEAHAILENLGLNLTGLSVGDVADLLVTTDTGDDGASTILITLRSKAFIERCKACLPTMDSLIAKVDAAYETTSPETEAGKDALEGLSLARRLLIALKIDHRFLPEKAANKAWETLENLDPKATLKVREAFEIS